MKDTSIDDVIDKGSALLRTLGQATKESLSARIGWRECISQATIKHEEMVLKDILNIMSEYMRQNLLTQHELVKTGLGSKGAATVGDHISVIQSQKDSIGGMLAAYIDTIAYHRSELNTMIGHILSVGVLALALLTIIVTLIGR